ncbi:uncharacterized protein METZ01_LOCUS346086 [marine metagenome]|uniref:Uncharacterized protein n=1 Tax=marine metagenome TaxID=408172 RepID=A0A382R7T1_9ZZZZ
MPERLLIMRFLFSRVSMRGSKPNASPPVNSSGKPIQSLLRVTQN